MLQKGLDALKVTILAGISHRCLATFIPELQECTIFGQDQSDVVWPSCLSGDVEAGHFLHVDIGEVCAFLEEQLEWVLALTSRCVVDWSPHLVVSHVKVGVDIKELSQDLHVRVDARKVQRRDTEVTSCLLGNGDRLELWELCTFFILA